MDPRAYVCPLVEVRNQSLRSSWFWNYLFVLLILLPWRRVFDCVALRLKQKVWMCWVVFKFWRKCYWFRIALKTMDKGEYLKRSSQTSCVRSIQNECRKAPVSSLLYRLRLVTYDPNRHLLCFFSLIWKKPLEVGSRVCLLFDLKKDRLTLDQGFDYWFWMVRVPNA